MALTRKILGTILIILGISTLLFGMNLLSQQQSWIIIGGFLVFIGLGYGFISLGLALVNGLPVRDAIDFLITVGRRSPK